MKYTVIIEKAPNNYCAFSPDIPGSISVADTYEEMLLMIREAIEFHFEGIELDGYPVPTPTAWVEMLEASGQQYVIVYEPEPDNYIAYVPDLVPECDVTGNSVEEVQQNIREAIADYLAGKELSGEPLPEPAAWAETMEIPHPSEVPA